MGEITRSSVVRYFTVPKAKAYDMLRWVTRSAVIRDSTTDKVIFEQRDVEVPDTWSLNALNTLAQKYFIDNPDTKVHENSLKHTIDRIVDTIVRQGIQEGYFEVGSEAETFREELKYILATQRASFDGLVWSNIGVPNQTQVSSACFILGVENNASSIMQWYGDEARIIEGGVADIGINTSSIGSDTELTDETARSINGPLSFIRAADSIAAAVRRPNKTHDITKVAIMNADHPDIEDFIQSKPIEKNKARALVAAGFDVASDGKDTFSIQYQNTHNSVRVTDDLIHAIKNDLDWKLRAVSTGKVMRKVKARDLWHQIAEAAWQCAEPSLQFDTTINKWNTTPIAGRIKCSSSHLDYMSLDNSACNIATINLLKYLNDDLSFNIEAFRHTVEAITVAQDILVGYSEYPTLHIAKTTRAYRQLGVGYANLGKVIMAQGLPYDSDESRAQAAAVTALMTGHAYVTSARIARKVGPFAGYHKDRDGMLKVLHMHREAVNTINAGMVAEDLLSAATQAWDEANELTKLYGVRNSQVSLLAPADATHLVMDCDTSGVEPNANLIQVKESADSDTMDSTNQTMVRALKTLGYRQKQIEDIVNYVDTKKTVLGAPNLQEKHLPVFACREGDNRVHYFAQVKMAAATQPFLSGAASNAVTTPADITIEDLERLYLESWTLGIKAISIRHDDYRNIQPLSLVMVNSVHGGEPASNTITPITDYSTIDSRILIKGAVRRRLPKVRRSKTYKFEITDLGGYFTVGEYEDGTPGELFINVSRQGSTLSGVMDSFAISVSHGLQYGVPLKSYVKAFHGSTYAPSGTTDDIDIRIASSITDYIFRRLALDYLSFDDRIELGLATLGSSLKEQTSLLDTPS
ncbi:MAG TPA: vitamin B12-dependent ribonucleotide reductase [Verrucomicrobiae bacterium]|nr:vitamin B12-dependent ribonucleotide reductase [Verrucomicrobiae bacterium]